MVHISTDSVLDFQLQTTHLCIAVLATASSPPRRCRCRLCDSDSDASFLKGFKKLVDIRNKVAAEPKVAAQYADKEDRAPFRGTISA
jgi:hypothetical protein